MSAQSETIRSVAVVRGPSLNAWEMQLFTPLLDEYALTGFTSFGHNFEITTLPFPVRKLFSVGQALRARVLREMWSSIRGDYHDLVGLGPALAGFDIIHCAESFYYCTYQAARAKRPAQKLVVTVWENIPFLVDHPSARAIKAEVFRAADLFLAVSERAREALILEGAPAAKIRVQFPGIDTGHFSPAPKEPELLRRFGCAPGDFVVLYVANLYREKGIFDLLYAFRRLSDRSPGAPLRLLVGGKGRDRDAVESRVRALGLTESVRLIGTHPYAEMPAVHNLADVFVLPSLPAPAWQEQFGYVLAESMACGKAVVSTMSGSIPEVVGDAGLLVQPNDPVSLASAIGGLLADGAGRRALGQRARQRAESAFNAALVSHDLRTHYKELFRHD